MDAANWNESTGERRARKHASGVRRRAGGKERRESYLACGLSYFLVGINGSKAEAEALQTWLADYLSNEPAC